MRNDMRDLAGTRSPFGPLRKASATTALGAIALVSAFASITGCSGGEGGPGGAGGFSPPPTPVETAAVERGSVRDLFEAVGSVEANEQIVVVAEIDGSVERLPFREGDAVDRGALLCQLEDSEISAQVERARAVRDQSKASFDRVKAVVEKGAGSPQDLDDAAAALRVAEADLALAEARLAKTRVTAPFAGMVGPRRVSPGAFVRAGEAMTELTQLQQVKVVFSAPERFVARMERGAAVTVRSTAFPDLSFDGRIDVVDPVLDPATRSLQVIARVDNAQMRLRPGMSADIAVVLGERPEALTIPAEAVFAEGGLSFVFVVQADSTVQKTSIQTGTRFRDTVEVTSGLAAGGRVVRAGHQKLYPGARIMPVDSRAASSAGGDTP